MDNAGRTTQGGRARKCASNCTVTIICRERRALNFKQAIAAAIGAPSPKARLLATAGKRFKGRSRQY